MKKIKQKKIKQQPVIENENYQIKNMFIIIIIITVILVPLYFITNLVLDKNSNTKKTETIEEETKVQSEKILLGQLLNRSQSSYYVIAYKKDNIRINLFNNYINKYKELDNHLEFYKIDLDDGLNKGYISEETNITDDLKDLKISDTTLFKIVDGKIDSYYIGDNDVVNELNKLVLNH